MAEHCVKHGATHGIWRMGFKHGKSLKINESRESKKWGFVPLGGINQQELMIGRMDAFTAAGFAKVVVRTPLTNNARQWNVWVFLDRRDTLCAFVTASREVLSLATIAGDSYMAVQSRALSHPVVNR